MAAVLEIDIQAQDNATRVFQQSATSARTYGSELTNVSRIAGGFVLGEAITKLPGLLMDSMKAAADDAASVARLKTAVDDTGAIYSQYQKQIEAVIANGQKLGFTDDQTRSALAILTAQTNSAEDAMRRYALAQDLSRGANIDVVTASRLLGKVTDENVNVLNRYGIAVQKGATETELFAAINAKFHGQAQAFSDTTAGKMAALNDKIVEAKESLGGLLIPIASPTISLFTKSVDGWALAFHAVGEGIDAAKGKLGDFLNMATGDKASKAKGFMDLTPEQRAAWDAMGTALDKTADHLLQLPPLQEAVTASQMNSIRASEAQTKATEAAYTALAASANPEDQAIARAHAAELADRAAAQAKSAASSAASEYAQTLPGMIDGLYAQAKATDLQNEAQRIYNEQMGIATDANGKAIKSFAQLVEEQKQSILESQQMAKATEEANRQLGIVSKTASSAADATANLTSSVNAQTSSVQANTAAWHQMTDAESQSSAKANASNSANTKPASSGGSVAYFSHGGGSTASIGGPGSAIQQRAASLAPGQYMDWQGNIIASNSEGDMSQWYASGKTLAQYYATYGGSHAGGLPYVPYDGYPAILHKGEKVLTAAQNADGGGNVVINVNVSGSINGVDDVKRIIRETLSGGGLRGYSFG